MPVSLKGKKKISVLFAILLIGAGALYGYREYSRTNKDLTDVDPVYVVADTALLHNYLNDERSANAQYLGKIIAVRGYIKELSGSGGASIKLALGSSPDGSSVSCVVDSTHAAELATLKTGDPVLLKGLVIGFNKDETGLLGSDVELTHCVLITGLK